MTYRELGKKTGRSYQYINEIMNGRTPSVNYACELAAVIGCKPDVLVLGSVDDRKKALDRFMRNSK